MGWEGPTTHRQYKAWAAWLEEEWDRPNRTDGYLMQIAAEVRRGHVKQPRRVRLKDFLLSFTGKKPAPTLTVEQASAIAKARWAAILSQAPQKPGPRRVLSDQPLPAPAPGLPVLPPPSSSPPRKLRDRNGDGEGEGDKPESERTMWS